MDLVEQIETHLAVIDEHTDLKALITVTREEALAQAKALAAARQRGQWPGLLDGMPVVIKDNIETAGVRTTSGSRFFANYLPKQDAPVVARLRHAGAICLGKASLHEFAFGIRSHNPLSGQCLNPWNKAHIPGGSSGGSAAAVAAGMCVGALGTDTGGSVRLPAAMCGVSGLRPTFGRVPNTGTTPVSPTQDTVGPMARSVADVARLFAVLAGYDAADPFSEDRVLENFIPTLASGISGVKIGIAHHPYFEGADSEIAAAVMEAARTVERLGARLTDVTLDGAADAHQFASTIIYSDACAFHRQRLNQQPETFAPQVYERMRLGLQFTGADYADALRERAIWRRRLAALFDTVDILLSPTVHTQVPRIDDRKSLHAATRDATRNTYAGAFGQLPGLSIPCGFTASGLPIGLQLEAKWWQEPLLLRAGYAYQSATDWHTRTP
ncbi:MAG: amidase [Gammaproteobacteria bacterium]|nr:amidase [Gammaproteobacteria bacterium]